MAECGFFSDIAQHSKPVSTQPNISSRPSWWSLSQTTEVSVSVDLTHYLTSRNSLFKK